MAEATLPLHKQLRRAVNRMAENVQRSPLGALDVEGQERRKIVILEGFENHELTRNHLLGILSLYETWNEALRQALMQRMRSRLRVFIAYATLGTLVGGVAGFTVSWFFY